MKGFLRTWEEFDLGDIEKYLIVAGELSGECFSCHKVGLDLKVRSCPECRVVFKYMGFRRKVKMSYLQKVKKEWPRVIFIDFEDFKRCLNKRDARKILDI